MGIEVIASESPLKYLTFIEPVSPIRLDNIKLISLKTSTEDSSISRILSFTASPDCAAGLPAVTSPTKEDSCIVPTIARKK